MGSPRPPSWLTQASLQVPDALHTLQEREATRHRARCFSRPAFLQAAQRRLRPPKLKQDVLDYYAVSVGSSHAHMHRNRYLEIEPYDRTRVVVDVGDDEPWYLNANYILERSGGKVWIATQAPLPGTAHAFLTLILRPNFGPSYCPRPSQVRTIVQLTQNVEKGFRKADPYFPTVVGQSMIIPPDEDHDYHLLKVTLRDVKSIKEAKCIISTVSIVPLAPPVGYREAPITGNHDSDDDDEDDYGVEDGPPTTFRHLLFYAWPDHGVPDMEDREALLAFIRLVDSTNRDLSYASTPDPPAQLDPDPPIIVGCSAGIGRTGSFIALCSLLRSHGFLPSPAHPVPFSLLPKTPLGPLPKNLQDDLVLQEIDSLRDQRPGMVQRTEQVLLVYEALKSAFSME